jgi:hypothetical protein
MTRAIAPLTSELGSATLAGASAPNNPCDSAPGPAVK